MVIRLARPLGSTTRTAFGGAFAITKRSPRCSSSVRVWVSAGQRGQLGHCAATTDRAEGPDQYDPAGISPAAHHDHDGGDYPAVHSASRGQTE
jgi:hypothetical protein